MYQRILVPFDGSPTSTRGLDEAIALARLTGARLRLLHLVDDLVYASGFETGAIYLSDVLPVMRQAGRTILANGRDRAQRAGIEADTELVEGMPWPSSGSASNTSEHAGSMISSSSTTWIGSSSTGPPNSGSSASPTIGTWTANR